MHRDALRLGSHLDRAVTEKGVLQLLLDLRFLRNSLSGGRPAPTAGGGGFAGSSNTAALSQRKRAFADLETSLQVLLASQDHFTLQFIYVSGLPTEFGGRNVLNQLLGLLVI